MRFLLLLVLHALRTNKTNLFLITSLYVTFTGLSMIVISPAQEPFPTLGVLLSQAAQSLALYYSLAQALRTHKPKSTSNGSIAVLLSVFDCFPAVLRLLTENAA